MVESSLRFLCLLTRANVSRDFGRPDDLSGGVLDRRHGQRDLNALAILALSDRLVMLDPLTTPDTRENACFLVVKFRWKEDGDRLANGFFGLKTKELRSAPVPSGDDSV